MPATATRAVFAAGVAVAVVSGAVVCEDAADVAEPWTGERFAAAIEDPDQVGVRDDLVGYVALGCCPYFSVTPASRR